jgi:DNA-binding response OmpR family regulator
MSGYEVCKELREDTDGPQPHVIILTAEGQQADRARAESVGADEFMTKPFGPLALRARVREILGEP